MQTALIMLRLAAALVFAIAVVPAVVLLVDRDYRRFLALGPGGTPQTFSGYLRVKVLGIFALWDPYTPSVPIREELCSKKGYLVGLPKRNHARPRTEGIAPHRQKTQQASKEVFKKLAAGIEGFAPGLNNDLTIGTSCFEKHGTGLFSTCPSNQTCRGEVVHVHPSDGSMHLTLHPADANIVLEAGWGERHPLAGVFFRRFLPESFMMLYAPQTEDEIETALRVVSAACWFVSGGGLTTGGNDSPPGRPMIGSCNDGNQQGGQTVKRDYHGNKINIEDPRKVLRKI